MRKTLTLLGAAVLTLAGCSGRSATPVVIEPTLVRVEVSGGEDADRAWVCHRGRWQEVAAAAVGGHSRHGDPVSHRRRPDRGRC